MLSRHPEACRFPHGHSRRIDVVVSADNLDQNGMVLDFKALKLALEEAIDKYDHSLAVNSADPLIEDLRRIAGERLVEFADTEPTTEAMAKEIFDFVADVLRNGWTSPDGMYAIPASSTTLERVRVTETPNSWAEYGL